MIRHGKTEVLKKKKKPIHVPLHLSQFHIHCLETEPGPSREEIGDCYVISYETRRQPIKTVAVSELHRGQIQIWLYNQIVI
jgi:hypothetical protein